MTITELDIPRNLWGSNALLRSDGRMCCLGHLSLACGVSKEEMDNLSYPHSSWFSVPDWARNQLVAEAELGSRYASNINDSKALSWREKEPIIINLFKSHGINLTFSGELDYQGGK